nr:hypothetical protein [uncultured Flavobacterium sp.]
MNIFSKINQKILERYPNIWNTKIVWILLIALCVHIIFFGIGFVYHSSPESLQERYILESFFTSGLIMVSVVISILILVGWLVYMFKNNAFKNFYPTTSLQLFGQFVQYFIIILVSTSFYFSYMFGIETYVKVNYPDAKMKQQIDLANKVYPFLSHNSEDYLLTNKRFPEIFSELFCETDPDEINYNLPYYRFYNEVYQFNEIYSVTVTERDSLSRFVYPKREAQLNIPLAYTDELEKKCIFYFKKNVVDMSDYIKDANLNYGNFSKVFYKFGDGSGLSNYIYDYESAVGNNESDFSMQSNMQTVDWLKTANKSDFNKLFTDYLKLLDKYKIKYNLTPETWVNLIFEKPNFEVSKLILSQKPYEDENMSYYNVETEYYDIVEGNTEESPLITERREFLKKATTKNYIESSNLKYLFENVDEIKTNNYFSTGLPIFFWIAFSFSTLIFSFRVTNLRALLFSIITSGVISLASGILFLIVGFVVFNDTMLVVLYYIFILGTLILLFPVVAPNFGSKLFRSILINISINGFVFYIFLILGIITAHQENECSKLNLNSSTYIPCKTILSDTEPEIISYILLTCGFLFILIYSQVIKKWKASAE